MTDILLIHLPPWGVFAPPLGIAYISSFLRKNGVNADIFDMNIELYNRTKEKGLWDFERKDEWNNRIAFDRIKTSLDSEIASCVEKILSVGSKYIGLSINQNGILLALEIARRIKETRDGPIIAGGWACYNKHEREILAKDGLIDIFVVGEGEEALHELIGALDRGEETDNVKGAGEISEDLDKLAFPTYEEFDLSHYQEDILCVLSSRGCMGRCVFCNDRRYQGAIRCRSPRMIIDEIAYHVTNNKIHEFSFNDLVINGNLTHLSQWTDLIIEKNLNIKWRGQAITRPDMDFELLYRMREAGCDTLQFGIESGSDRVLKNMRKMFRASDAERVLAMVHKAGIKTWINLIVGFPGEEEEDFVKTGDFIKRNRHNIDCLSSINSCNVVFGSDLMDFREEYGIILSENPELLETDWHLNDDNCNRLRKERGNRLTSLARELGLPVGQSNLSLLPA